MKAPKRSSTPTPPAVPIALFLFNRPDHARLTLESLVANHGFEAAHLYIFCDGPRRAADRDDVEETREVARSFGLRNATLVERPENLGCARSILTGVDEVLAKHGRVIVVEDDYDLTPWFLDFMNRALEHYADDERVMHVSGYTFPTERELAESFFLRPAFGACWGWGTWSRAWRHLERDPRKLIARLADEALRHEFCLRGSTRYYQRLHALAAGKLDVWEVLWYASVFLHGGLCLRPGTSLLFNLGNDGTGVNCVETDIFDVAVADGPIGGFPTEVAEDEEALRAVIEFHASLRQEAFAAKVKGRFGGRSES